MIETGVAGNTLTAEEARDDRRLNAMAQGYKFIELELNQVHVREAQREVRFSGVQVADVFADGRLPSGLPNMRSVVVGGYLIIKLDELKLKWIGYLLDIEINRKFLVNHWSDPKEDWAGGDKFIVMDPGVRAEIEHLYNIERAHAKKEIIKLRKENTKESRSEMGKQAHRFRFDLENIDTEVVIDIPEEIPPETVVKTVADPVVLDENQKLKEEIKALKEKLKKKPRKARRRKKKPEVANVNDKKNDNNVAAGGERLEQGRGQGNTTSP